MDENLHDIEHLFKNALDDYEDLPEDKVWKEIEHSLDKSEVDILSNKYRQLKRLVVLLILLIIGFSVYELGKTNHEYVTANNHKVVNKNMHNTADETLPINTGETLNNKAGKSFISSNKGESLNSNDGENPISKANKPIKNESTTNKANEPLADKNMDAKKVSKNTVDDNIRSMPSEQIDATKSLQSTNIGNAINSMNIPAHRKLKSSSSVYKNKFAGSTGFSTKTYSPVGNNEEITTIGSSRKPEQPINNKTPGYTVLPPFYPVSVAVNEFRKPLSAYQGILSTSNLNKISFLNSSVTEVINKVKLSNQHHFPLSLVLFFSPDFDYYRLEDDKKDRPERFDDAKETDRSESHQFSSTSGLLLNYKLNNRWSVQSGLTYSNINITLDPKTVYAQADQSGSIKYFFNTSSGSAYFSPSFSSHPAVGDSLYTATSTHKLSYLGIPVTAKYSIEKGKFLFNAGAGVSVNFLLQGKIKTEVESGLNKEAQIINNLDGLKNIYLSGIATAGINYQLSNKLALVFDPSWRFPLNAINKDAIVKSYPFSFCLVTGVRWRIK